MHIDIRPAQITVTRGSPSRDGGKLTADWSRTIGELAPPVHPVEIKSVPWETASGVLDAAQKIEDAFTNGQATGTIPFSSMKMHCDMQALAQAIQDPRGITKKVALKGVGVSLNLAAASIPSTDPLAGLVGWAAFAVDGAQAVGELFDDTDKKVACIDVGLALGDLLAKALPMLPGLESTRPYLQIFGGICQVGKQVYLVVRTNQDAVSTPQLGVGLSR